MKRIKVIVLCILGMFCTMQIWAYDFECDGIYYNFISDTNNVEVTYKVKKEATYSNEIIIPDTVVHSHKTYNVTCIGEMAFANCIELSSIILPNSIDSIKSLAFANCIGLTLLTLPVSVTNIGKYAFFYCTKLSSISFPNSLKNIEEGAFTNCNALASLTIPNCVLSIERGAFNGCGTQKVEVYWDIPINIENYTFQPYEQSKSILVVPKGKISLYQASIGWKNFKTIEDRWWEESTTEDEPMIMIVKGRVD
jgi:hypothetical protein